ncbi:hypothetical protein Tco_0884084 [Tanacetum coccineum]
MEEAFPIMVDDRVKELTKTQVPLYVAKGLIMERKQNQADVAKMIADVDSSVRNYMSTLKIKFEGFHASHTPCRSSAIRPRDQDDPHDDAHPKGDNSAKRQKTYEHGTYTDTYATDNDELPAEKVSRELVEEMLETVDEATLRKVVGEMLRQLCTSGDKHHCQRVPKAPALSLVNQDLLYLKKGNSGSEKIVLSLHKFSAVIFPDDEIKERTSRWVDKCVKKFNPFARHRHEHKFVTKIITRRENGSTVSITEPDYKNLNKKISKDTERFQDHPLEGHDLLLWGDLRMIFDPDEKDKL